MIGDLTDNPTYYYVIRMWKTLTQSHQFSSAHLSSFTPPYIIMVHIPI